MTDFVLTGLVNYGAPALALALLIAAIGAPLPTTLLVVAGGAFARQGLLSTPLTFTLALSAAVLGDSISYGLGVFAGDWVENRYGQTKAWGSARNTFQRRGGWTIYITRFLLTSLALPVNLLAGTTHYGYRRFLPLVLAGELTWIIGFGSLGYAFGSQWELVSQFLADFGGLIFGAVLLAIGAYLGIRYLLRRPGDEEEVAGEPVVI